jgi:hypothetical protein
MVKYTSFNLKGNKLEIEVSGNVINIKGNIITISDAHQIVQLLNSLTDKNFIVIRILDSFALPSSVIGELLKLHKKGKNIVIEVKDNVLYELLDDLGLTKIFSVKKV